jgi:hypothetical protein
MPTMHKENDWAIRVNGDERIHCPMSTLASEMAHGSLCALKQEPYWLAVFGQQHGWHQRWLGLRRTKTNFLQSTGG